MNFGHSVFRRPLVALWLAAACCRGEDVFSGEAQRLPGSAARAMVPAEDVDRLRAALQAELCEVQEGYFRIYDVRDCAWLPRCWVNNPTSPYGMLQVPLSPDEPDPDPDLVYTLDADIRPLFRLRADEALVFVGSTPPVCPYYSFTAYVFNRHNPRGRAILSPYEGRAEVFASLGDSLNHLVLKTSAAPGQDAFDKLMVMIVTADRGTERTVRGALAEAGFPESMVNTLVIPRFAEDGVTPLARMGYDSEADVFNVLARIAHQDAAVPGTPINEWLLNPGSVVLRVRPIEPKALDPIPFPALRAKGTGRSEDGLSLARLVRRIVAGYGRDRCRVMPGFPVPWEDGYFCMNNLIPCFGDCRDTPYMVSFARLGPPPEALVIAGYNHQKSGKACYANVTVTRLNGLTAFYSVVMDDLAGSAEAFLPGDPAASNLWQVTFRRAPSDDPYTFEVTEEQVPLNEPLMVVVRAYLEPETGTGAKALPFAASELAFPRVIKIEGDPAAASRSKPAKPGR